jgi:hypothetical protein
LFGDNSQTTPSKDILIGVPRAPFPPAPKVRAMVNCAHHLEKRPRLHLLDLPRPAREPCFDSIYLIKPYDSRTFQNTAHS